MVASFSSSVTTVTACTGPPAGAADTGPGSSALSPMIPDRPACSPCGRWLHSGLGPPFPGSSPAPAVTQAGGAGPPGRREGERGAGWRRRGPSEALPLLLLRPGDLCGEAVRPRIRPPFPNSLPVSLSSPPPPQFPGVPLSGRYSHHSKG